MPVFHNTLQPETDPDAERNIVNATNELHLTPDARWQDRGISVEWIAEKAEWIRRDTGAPGGIGHFFDSAGRLMRLCASAPMTAIPSRSAQHAFNTDARLMAGKLRHGKKMTEHDEIAAQMRASFGLI